MEDTRGKTRLQNFFTISVDNPQLRCENYMISLRKKNKNLKFNEVRFKDLKYSKNSATSEEIKFINENKDQNTLNGFVNCVKVISEIQSHDEVNSKLLKFNLMLLLEYVDCNKANVDELFTTDSKVTFEYFVSILIDSLDKFKEMELSEELLDSLDRVYQIMITICECKPIYFEMFFYADRLMIESTNIFSKTIDSFEEQFTSKSRSKDVERKITFLLNDIIHFYTNLCENPERREIMLNDGEYLVLLSKIFRTNKKAYWIDLWCRCCYSVISLLEKLPLLDYEQLSDILVEIGYELTEVKDSNLYSYATILTMISQPKLYEDENNKSENKVEFNLDKELTDRVMFTKLKISNIFDVLYDRILEEIEEPDIDETQQKIKLKCFDLINLFIEYDDIDNTFKLTHDTGFNELIKIANDPKFNWCILLLLKLAVDRYRDIYNNQSEIQNHEKNNIVDKLINSHFIQNFCIPALDEYQNYYSRFKIIFNVENMYHIFLSAPQITRFQFIRLVGSVFGCLDNSNLDRFLKTQLLSQNFIGLLIENIDLKIMPRLVFLSLEFTQSLFHSYVEIEGRESDVIREFEERGGLDALNECSSSQNQEIYRVSQEIIKEFFNSELQVQPIDS